MTSMPASRSARAIIFAPRSWPSRPGLAIRTRIFLVGIGYFLGDGDFFVRAKNVAHGFADFAERGVGLHGVVNKGYEIFFAARGSAQGIEAAVYFRLGAIGAELFEALG